MLKKITSTLKRLPKFFQVILAIIIAWLLFQLFFIVRINYNYLDNIKKSANRGVIDPESKVYHNFNKNGSPAYLQWLGDKLMVEKNTYNYMKDNARQVGFVMTIYKFDEKTTEWIKFLELKNSAGCGSIFLTEKYLNCLSDTRISQIDNNGRIAREKDFDSSPWYHQYSTFEEQLAIIPQDSEITFIWRDSRARLPNPRTFFAVFADVDRHFGPHLLMAGKLNLDTLDFKEYVIGYNARNLEDIGITPK